MLAASLSAEAGCRGTRSPIAGLIAPRPRGAAAARRAEAEGRVQRCCARARLCLSTPAASEVLSAPPRTVPHGQLVRCMLSLPAPPCEAVSVAPPLEAKRSEAPDMPTEDGPATPSAGGGGARRTAKAAAAVTVGWLSLCACRGSGVRGGLRWQRARARLAACCSALARARSHAARRARTQRRPAASPVARSIARGWRARAHTAAARGSISGFRRPAPPVHPCRRRPPRHPRSPQPVAASRRAVSRPPSRPSLLLPPLLLLLRALPLRAAPPRGPLARCSLLPAPAYPILSCAPRPGATPSPALLACRGACAVCPCAPWLRASLSAARRPARPA
jgi:hypothetical protein